MNTNNTSAAIFVAMPFDKILDNVFFTINQIGINKGYTVFRADNINTPEPIFDHLKEKIAESDLVIADVTLPNPNVYLELGYSWGIGKEVLLIAEKDTELPFDIGSHRVFFYPDKRNAKAIMESISDAIEKTIKKAKSTAKIKLEALKIAQKFSRIDNKSHLYYRLLETQIRRITNEIDFWLNGSMEVNRNILISKGIEIFDTMSKGGFATFLAPLEGYWEENNDYVNKSREVASDTSRHLYIERVYILSTISSVTSNQLLRNINSDEAANIKTFVVFKDEVSAQSVKDFGIWDDEVVCIINMKENSGRSYEVLGGKFTRLQKDIEEYEAYKAELRRVAINGTTLIKEVNQLSDSKKSLLQTVEIMEELSTSCCKGGYISESNCFWYHSAWQYLRLIDVVSTPSWHETFYTENLKKYLNSKKNTRILISGTADYGMLEQILKTRPSEEQIEEVIIIDLCDTPLSICREYYKKYLTDIFVLNTLTHDIRNTNIADESCDIIITDAFLTRFPKTKRKEVVSKWHKLLKDNGVVITTARIEDGEEIKSSKEDINRFITKVKSRIDSSGTIMRHMLEKITSKAKEYASNIVSYPINSPKEIQELFSEFGEININLHSVEGEIRDGTLYAQIVARK